MSDVNAAAGNYGTCSVTSDLVGLTGPDSHTTHTLLSFDGVKRVQQPFKWVSRGRQVSAGGGHEAQSRAGQSENSQSMHSQIMGL